MLGRDIFHSNLHKLQDYYLTEFYYDGSKIK